MRDKERERQRDRDRDRDTERERGGGIGKMVLFKDWGRELILEKISYCVRRYNLGAHRKTFWRYKFIHVVDGTV